jgi:tRNA pseudouridine55 synthase
VDGLLVIDKPEGPTSHDVVQRMRRTLGQRRIGHTGTLDPAATGVLPLVLGSATRLARFLSGATKQYVATIALGVSTDSYDSQGEPVGQAWPGSFPDTATIEAALASFRGTFEQQPPALSAKKIQGERSHRLARRRREDAPASPMPAPAKVTIHRLHIVEHAGRTLVLDVECSAGFYVRSLAQDLGQRLGTGAHLSALRRTRSGEIGLSSAVPLAEVADRRDRALAAVIPTSRMLPGLPEVLLSPEGVVFACHGREIGPAHWTGGLPVPGDGAHPVRLIGPDGVLVGLGRPGTVPGALHPFVVLV